MVRVPREITERDETTREATGRQWRPPTGLPEPDPVPGWVHRWIMVSMYGENRAEWTDKKLREGWIPVTGSEQPKIAASIKNTAQVTGKSRSDDDVIIYGGLMLCRMPEDMVEQRNAHYRKFQKQAEKSVDDDLRRLNDPRMPLMRMSGHNAGFGYGRP